MRFDNKQMQADRKSLEQVHTSVHGIYTIRKRTTPENVPEIRKQTDSSSPVMMRLLNSSLSSQQPASNTLNTSQKLENTMVTDLTESQDHAQLQRKELWSRKDLARRNLMGHLYARQPPLKRSFSFVAGEKPSNEFVFPQLYKKQLNGEKNEKRNTETTRRSKKYEVNKTKSNEKTTANRVHRSGTEGKISLPELINDISARMRTGSESMSSEDNNETDSQVEDLDTLPIRTGKLKMFKYRPLTPGLIDKLNKLRLPTKCRTEQWIQTLPMEHQNSATVVENYREVRTRENSAKTSTVQDWIYSDT